MRINSTHKNREQFSSVDYLPSSIPTEQPQSHHEHRRDSYHR